jgi:L-ascorbate metabolism protein UlaG (beta-lactamase superfamily)
MTAPDGPPDASLFFIGNATTLIRFGELTLLTDPNFLHAGQHAYLGHGLVSRRLTDPALDVSELPPLDGVVLSHLHGDHWDRVAQRGLDRDLPVVTTPQARSKLQRRGFAGAAGLATWESTTLTAGATTVRITALPGRHATGWLRHLLPPVMGSMLEFSTGGGPVEMRLYLSGDTLLIDDLTEIPQRFPRIDNGVLHLGGTRLPGGFSRGPMVTMDARQGADLMELIDPTATIPVHFDDYPVFTSPLSDFRDEAQRRGLLERVRFVERGGTVPLVVGGDRRPGRSRAAGTDTATSSDPTDR